MTSLPPSHITPPARIHRTFVIRSQDLQLNRQTHSNLDQIVQQAIHQLIEAPQYSE